MEITAKKIIKDIISIVIIILLFALVDYFFHQLSERYSVPSRYFPNKIIYGTVIGLIAFWLLAKIKKIGWKSLIFSAIVASLLQIRYFLEGYPLDFVILFLFIHFVILWLISFLTFKLLIKKIPPFNDI